MARSIDDMDRDVNLGPGANVARPRPMPKPAAKGSTVRYDADGQLSIQDHNYRGYNPFDPGHFFRFLDPRNRKKAKMPNQEIAHLDPDWNEHNSD